MSVFNPKNTLLQASQLLIFLGEDDTADRIANSISMALKNLRKVEGGQVKMDSKSVDQSQVDAIEIVSILGKIKRDQELQRAKTSLVTNLDLWTLDSFFSSFCARQCFFCIFHSHNKGDLYTLFWSGVSKFQFLEVLSGFKRDTQT